MVESSDAVAWFRLFTVPEALIRTLASLDLLYTKPNACF